MKLVQIPIPKQTAVCLLCFKPLIKGKNFTHCEQLAFPGVHLMCCEEHLHFAAQIMESIKDAVVEELHNLETIETHTE